MADATVAVPPPDTALHDGWSSRKVIMASVLMGLLLALSGVAVAFDKATFSEAASFVNWALGAIWVPLVIGMSADKLVALKAKALGQS